LRHILAQELGILQVLGKVVPEHASLCIHPLPPIIRS
jgi:hypothetical protein